MSQYVVTRDIAGAKYTVRYGWDPPLKGYFLQLEHTCAIEDPDDDEFDDFIAYGLTTNPMLIISLNHRACDKGELLAFMKLLNLDEEHCYAVLLDAPF